jgi:hypothetical protein
MERTTAIYRAAILVLALGLLYVMDANRALRRAEETSRREAALQAQIDTLRAQNEEKERKFQETQQELVWAEGQCKEQATRVVRVHEGRE